MISPFESSVLITLDVHTKLKVPAHSISFLWQPQLDEATDSTNFRHILSPCAEVAASFKESSELSEISTP